MKNQKGISSLVGIIIIAAVAIILFGGVFAYQYFMKPQISPETAGSPAKALATEGWKIYTNSQYGFSFQYPATFCFGNNRDNSKCNLYAKDTGNSFDINQTGNPSNSPIFSISYVKNIDKKDIEKYLEDKYIDPSDPRGPAFIAPLAWIVDKDNPEIISDGFQGLGLFAAYSGKFKTLISFYKQPACIFDCKLDSVMLNSIKLDETEVIKY